MAKLQDKFFNRVIEGKLEVDSSDSVVSALQDKDLKVKTIEQSEANFSLPFELEAKSGLKINNTYNRFEIINNILYIITNVEIFNDTGSTISLTYLADCAVTLPKEIAEKIFDSAGNSAHKAGAGVWIASELGFIKEKNTGSYPDSYGQKAFCELMLTNNNTADIVTIALTGAESLGIPTGKSEFLSARIALTII